MQRRSFIKSLLALPVAASLPSLVKPETMVGRYAEFQRMWATGQDALTRKLMLMKLFQDGRFPVSPERVAKTLDVEFPIQTNYPLMPIK